MISPTQVFYLYRYHGERCEHGPVLFRVTRPEYHPTSLAEENRAYAEEERRLVQLIQQYEARFLQERCGGSHQATLIGIFDWDVPCGEALYAEQGNRYLDIWLAGTRYGHPYVVLGTARSERLFWDAIQKDTLLKNYEPLGPARRLRSFFLTDNDL